MELHSHITAKELWKILRITFFMMRKGLASKRKLMLDMNLMMKRGKVLRKSLSNLITFIHPHHHHHVSSFSANTRNAHTFGGVDEYEFSCSNSPIPIFVRVNSKRKYSYFPCIKVTSVEDDREAPPAIIALPRIEYSPQCVYNLSELAPGERCTPMTSPFAVRISNFSSAEEGDGLRCEVDDQAEEFIRRFYQQLQAQNRIAMN